jgi:hypothetical protein
MMDFHISSDTADRIFNLANILLIVGAVFALVGTITTIWTSGIRENYANERISKNELETAQANAQAAQAKLELAHFKAPRMLSSDAQTRISDQLKLYSGIAFDMGMGPKGDPEPLYLLRSIHSALSLAKWQHIPWTGGGEMYTEADMPSIGLTSVTNIIVDVSPSHWAKFGPAAKALASALNAEGIDTEAQSSATSINSDAIHIRIGRKL